MKMVYTYEVTIAVDLFAEPVVVEHTILADTRHNRRCILRSHLDHSPRTKLQRAVLLRAHKATAEEIRRSAECAHGGVILSICWRQELAPERHSAGAPEFFFGFFERRCGCSFVSPDHPWRRKNRCALGER